MKSYPVKFESFQWKIVQMGALQKLQNFIQTLKILWPAFSLPFSSSKYFYSFLRWLKTVSSTFQDVDFDVSFLPLVIT